MNVFQFHVFFAVAVFLILSYNYTIILLCNKPLRYVISCFMHCNQAHRLINMHETDTANIIRSSDYVMWRRSIGLVEADSRGTLFPVGCFSVSFRLRYKCRHQSYTRIYKPFEIQQTTRLTLNVMWYKHIRANINRIQAEIIYCNRLPVRISTELCAYNLVVSLS